MQQVDQMLCNINELGEKSSAKVSESQSSEQNCRQNESIFPKTASDDEMATQVKTEDLSREHPHHEFFLSGTFSPVIVHLCLVSWKQDKT